MTTFTAQPDAAAGKDAYITSAGPNTNTDGTTEIRAGEQDNQVGTVTRALVQFDLSSIPSNAKVSSATLSLWLVSTNLATNNRTLRAYRLEAAWTEGQVTWNDRQGSTPWTTAGAADDAEATDIGSVALTTGSSGEQQISLDADAVEAWINGTFTNNGLLLMMDTELDDCYRFHSSDSSTAAERPQLVIEYTTGGGTKKTATVTAVGTMLGG